MLSNLVPAVFRSLLAATKNQSQAVGIVMLIKRIFLSLLIPLSMAVAQKQTQYDKGYDKLKWGSTIAEVEQILGTTLEIDED